MRFGGFGGGWLSRPRRGSKLSAVRPASTVRRRWALSLGPVTHLKKPGITHSHNKENTTPRATKIGANGVSHTKGVLFVSRQQLRCDAMRRVAQFSQTQAAPNHDAHGRMHTNPHTHLTGSHRSASVHRNTSNAFVMTHTNVHRNTNAVVRSSHGRWRDRLVVLDRQ